MKFHLKAKQSLAFVLAILMVVTTVFVMPGQAFAKAKKPTMITKTAVAMNGTKTIKLNKNGFTIKAVKVTSTKKNIAQVVATKKAVTVYGIKAGKTKITTVVNAEKEGKNKKYTLTTEVTVKSPSASLKKNTLAVGEKTGVKLLNKVKGTQVNYSVEDEGIASVDKTGNVTALAEGTTKVSVTFILPKTKFAKQKSLTVSAGTLKVEKGEEPAVTGVTVQSQEELEKALTNTALRTLEIGKEAGNLTIPEGTFKDVELLVDAPKASIVNKAQFKVITIKAVAANTFTEEAKGNTIICENENSIHIIVKGVLSTLIMKAKGNILLDVGGKVERAQVKGCAKAEINGNLEVLDIKEAAADAKITVKTATVKVETSEQVNADTIIDNQSGKELTTTVFKADGKTETTTVKTDTSAGVGETIGGGIIRDDIDFGGDTNKTEPKIIKTTDLKAALLTANSGDTIALTDNISEDVDATWDKSGSITIDFGTHTVGGNFKIFAPTAKQIIMTDGGVETAGGKITGNLVVDAQGAHVENYLEVVGEIQVRAVANHSFVQYEKADAVKMLGGGRLCFGNNIETVPPVYIETVAPVFLAGGIKNVTVNRSNADISIAEDTLIDKIEIPSSDDTNSVTIKGEGRVANLEAAANVSIAVSVDTLEVKSNSAAVAIESGKTVDNLKVAAGVTSVAVSGEGTLQAVDLTGAGEAVAGLTVTVPDTTKVVVTREQATQLASSESSLKDKVVTVSTVQLLYDSPEDNDGPEETCNQVYAVGEPFDIENFYIKVTYSDGAIKTLPVSAAMLNKTKSDQAGEIDVTATYGGVASAAIAVSVWEKDEITFTWKWSNDTYILAGPNGDNEYYDCWTILARDFAKLKAGEIFTATSAKNLEVKYEYKLLEGEYDVWTSGLPEKPEGYVIRVYTDDNDTDKILGDQRYFWIWNGEAQSDHLTLDKKEAAALAETYGFKLTDSEDCGVCLSFSENADFSKLEELLNKIVKSENGEKLQFAYYAAGQHDSSHYYENKLPTVKGHYVVHAYTDSSEGVLELEIQCVGAKFNSAAIRAWIGDESQPESSVTPDDEGTLTLEKDKEYNLGVEIKNPNATKHVYYARVIAQQGGNSKIEKIDALSQEAGTYYVYVCAEESGEIAETWSQFTIIVK
ncbi:MAG: hypothetical protein E7280_08255 [Lachnospiraceae bacterium]|jgi:hypothetical protein|nr:hypothetical protein [Lachnospiraceae bacterium]